MAPKAWQKNRERIIKTIYGQEGSFTPRSVWNDHRENPDVVAEGTPVFDSTQTTKELVEDLIQTRHSGIEHAGPGRYIIRR